MRVIIDDFSIADHLAVVLQAGKNTPEFAVGEETLFWSADVLASWQNLAGGPMLVAIDWHGEIVGFLLSTFQGTGVATIENILVAQVNRRQRVASALLDEFERRASAAAMRCIHSFSHVSNEAVSRLLARRGYHDLGIAKWCSGNPQAMLSSRDASLYRYEAMEIRPMPPQDVDEAWIAGSHDSGLAGGAGCLVGIPAKGWLFTSADMLHGAFWEQRLVGLATTSVHQPTSKATIESIVLAQALGKLPAVEALVGAVVCAVAERGIRYLTAYPAAAVPLLLKKLVEAGFVEQRSFRLHSKDISSATHRM